jgi:hypothetical protein
MAQLSSAQEERFYQRFSRFLRENFPDERDVSAAHHRAIHEPLVVKARSYGLETEQQIAIYLLVAKVQGKDFDTALQGAKAILLSNDLEAPEKSNDLESLIFI